MQMRFYRVIRQLHDRENNETRAVKLERLGKKDERIEIASCVEATTKK